MSETAHLLLIMKRALARSDAELYGRRALYEARARQLTARLFNATEVAA